MSEGRWAEGTIDVLRTAQRNTLTLSAMADQKASVVLGASFVMASITFGDLRDGGPSAPEVMLAVTAVASGLLAALAVMPRIAQPSKHTHTSNLLFFGAIAGIDHDEYFEQMTEMLCDDEAVHLAMLEDLYQASLVLARRKYVLLRLSYVVLTIGMVATLIAFLVA